MISNYFEIANEWFFGNNKKDTVYAHEYECDFLISINEGSGIDPDYASKADKLWDIIRGEDKDDSVINNLVTYMHDYYFDDLENTFEEKKKRLWSEFNLNDKKYIKNVRKNLNNKKLITEPYIIKTNDKGNFLKLDRTKLVDNLFEWSGGDAGKYPNGTKEEKDMTSEIFKMATIYVNAYNEVADEIFKKLKKTK